MISQKENLAREEIKSLQEQRMLKAVKWAYERVPFYRETARKNEIDHHKIKSLKEIESLPFTTKEDLRLNYPYGMMAVDLKDIIRLHASSGTTGKPVVAGYTRADLENWSEMIARIASMAGATAGDIAQVSFGYGLFTGGFGLHYGLEKLGATVVPFSSGNTERQLELMQDFKTTVLVSTPSFAVYMAEQCREMGMDPAKFNLRLGLFGGEPCSDLMREEIEREFNITATLNYGLTEVCGPGVSGECPEQKGMHILEDYFYPEIIDPCTGEVLPPGEKGELVLTPLCKEGSPVIRYRTRDITRLIPEPCPCGRTTYRMDYVTGRTDDMIIIKGVNIFPSQIEEVLSTFSEVSPHYLLVLKKERSYIKDLEVQVEVNPAMFSDSFKKMASLEENIRNRLKTTLSLTPKVKLMEPRSLERTTGKSRRIVEA